VNEVPAHDPEALSESLARRVDQVCNRFEAAWKAGTPPRLEDFLGDAPGPERAALLRELVPLDVYYRRARGEDCRPEDYRDRFPDLDPAQVSETITGPDGSDTADSPAPTSAVTIPAALIDHPRYRVLRLLGHGGMGAVYQAEHLLMERSVALKIINKSLTARPDLVERFRREVKAAARLSHPNIVTAHDADQAGDTHFLVMEFAEGQSLDEVLENEGPLPVAQACDYVRQAALGLQHAHERGLVHRDIKPHNLMLTPQGQVKILDFGLAKMAREQGAGQGLTASGAYMGTPEYSAPEQATDARKADIRADLYSLGCTLYCLLAGRPPFREETAVLTILAHLEKEPVPLPELRPDVPAGLWAVVARLLAKDPDRRYQKPAEVAQALAPFCQRGGNAGPVPPGTPKPAGAAAPAVRAPIAGDARDEADPAALLSREQMEAAPPRGDVCDLLGADAGRKRGGRRRVVLAGALGCLGLLVLGALGLGGLAVLSIRTNGTDSRQAALPRPGAIADTGTTQPTPAETARGTAPAPPVPAKAPGVSGARPAPLDCTGAAGVSAAEVRKAQAAWATYLGRQVEETVEVADGVKMTFVLVPPGTFRMGSPADETERQDNETLHGVTLTEPFDLARTEVTQAQYLALTGHNPSKIKGEDNLPVETVSWEEAHDYAVRLTKKRADQHVYRLPTEAEWEYSCRGGRPSSKPWGIGDGTSLSSREANFDGNSPLPPGGANKGPFLESTCRVGSYAANALGLYDMHGNVWEWCADWAGPYPEGDATNPTGPAWGSARVMRGGGWGNPAELLRAGDRRSFGPGDRHFTLGFRLARSIPSGGE
jgi:formylglycine-generating enzyme required for sulfatase activity